MTYLAKKGTGTMTPSMVRFFNESELLCLSDLVSMDLDACHEFLEFVAAWQRILAKHMRQLERQATT